MADTSTEEWVVENCSPKKSPMLTSTQLPLEANPNPNTINKHQEEQFSTNKESEETSIWNRDKTPTKIKEATRKNHNVENKKETEASETVIPGEAAKTPKMVSQNKKRGRKKKNTSEIPKADDSFDLQLQIALKESVELYRKEQMKEKEKQVENTSPQSKSINTDIVTKDDHVFAKPEIPVLNSVETHRMSSILGTEETFFDMKVVYNSTSLSDNRTARSKLRELNGHHKEENEDATNETSKKQNRLAKKVRRSISIQTEEDHTTSTEQLQIKDIKEDGDNQSVVVQNRLPRDFEDNDDLKDQGNRCQETIDNKTKDTEDVGTDQEQNGEFVISSKKDISEWEGMKPVNNTAEYFAREENQNEESIFTADTSKVKKSKGAKKPKQVLVEQNKSKGVTTSKRLLSSKKEISVTGLTFELENTATNANLSTKKKLSIQRHHHDSESGEENKSNSEGDTIGALKPDHTNTTNSRNGLSKAEAPLKIVKKRGPRKKSATKPLSSSDNEHSKTNESQSKKTNRSKNSKQHNELSKKKKTSKRQINETEDITEEDHGLHSNGDRINNKNDLIPTKLLKKAVSNTTNQESNRNEYHSNQKLTTEEDTSRWDKKEEKPQRKHKSIAEQTIAREPTTKSKTANNNSNVTSTTTMLHSPESQDESRRTNKILSRRRMVALPDSESKYDDNNNNDDIDCTVVTSTTHIETVDEIEVPEETKSTSSSFSSSSASSSQTVIRKPTMITNVSPKDRQSNLTRYDPNKGILIYTPHNSSLAPDHSLSKDGGFFNITLEHLSTIIGQKPAEKFLKYYIGRRRFNSKSTVYFRPPATGVQDTSEDSTSDSDDDDLEFIGRYGDLYESFGGSEGGGHHVV